jgi:hypothetical protein
LAEYEDVWKMNFIYKKMKLGSALYFKIEVKALEHVKDIEEVASGKDDRKEVVSEISNGARSCSENVIEN